MNSSPPSPRSEFTATPGGDIYACFSAEYEVHTLDDLRVDGHGRKSDDEAGEECIIRFRLDWPD